MRNNLRRKLSRREFLKLTAATMAAVPTLAGADLLYESRGVLPNKHDAFEDARSLDYETSDIQPILIIVNDLGSNPFGTYLGEILLTEGINSFHIMKLSDLNFEHLSKYDIVILSDGAINQDQAEKFSKYVFYGGNLVAMHPDAGLLPILGLKQQAKTSDQNYIIIDREHELALGISPVSMQYHSDVNEYLLNGAQAVAWLCNKNGETKKFPAVTINKYETGWACAWTYDLASSVILTRQGNPKWANQERDGFDGIRPSDMFYGWLDLDRIEIPQADEQQRLLINVINFLSRNTHPLPRLWYFPDNCKSILITTSDSHQNPAWAIEKVISHAEKYGGYISVYSQPPSYTIPYRVAQKVRWWLANMSFMREAYFPAPSTILQWRERGHEFGIHPVVFQGFKKGWEDDLKRFSGVGYGPLSPTTRVHWILWDGWTESARMQAEYGFRMNLDYYHIGKAFQKATGEWVYGHFTGSGLPMKFVDEQGHILNIYQQLTHLADDHLLNLHWGGEVKLPAEQAVEVSKMLLDRSINGEYAAIGAIFHTDPFAVGEPWATEEAKWMDGTLGYAFSKSIPIWSSEKWLNFTEARHNTSVESLVWDQSREVLRFKVDIPKLQSGSISMLLPLTDMKRKLSGLDVNGQHVEFMLRTLGSTEYAWFLLAPGRNNVDAFYR